jgi:hypothetical protein
MKIDKRSCKEANTRLAAEDEAVFYLLDDNRFTSQTSIAIAIRVEFLLALAWEDLQEEMRARSDPREVMEISPYHMLQIRKAFVSTPPALSDAAAEQQIVDLLRKFPPDRAWHIASKVRRSVESWWSIRSPESSTQIGSAGSASCCWVGSRSSRVECDDQ